MKKKILFVIMLFFLSIAGYARGLKGIIYVSNQTEGFDPSKVVREYLIGETAYCVLLVQGYLTNSSGFVNLTADIKFIDLNGNVLFEEENYAKAKTYIRQNQKIVVLDNSFDIEFTQEDPPGMYTIEAVIRDNIKGTQDKVQTTIFLFDSEKSKNIIMTPVRDAKQLDDLWKEYFRSKNPLAVMRIISALRLRKESPSLDDACVGAAAKWSLKVNAKKYPDVLKICKQSLKQTKGTIKELLQEVITNVENKK